jgi:hypothetical protein
MSFFDFGSGDAKNKGEEESFFGGTTTQASIATTVIGAGRNSV